MRYQVFYTEGESIKDTFRTPNWEDALEAFEDFAAQIEATFVIYPGTHFTKHEWCAEREDDNGNSIAAVVLNDYGPGE